MELNTEDEQYYKQFNFVNCINVVEELEKEEDVALLIKKCSDLAKKFAFISHVNQCCQVKIFIYFNSLFYLF